MDSPDVVALPITDTAKEVGGLLTTNTVALGALVALAGLVTEEELRAALRSRIKAEALSINEKAFNAGLLLGARFSVAPSPPS